MEVWCHGGIDGGWQRDVSMWGSLGRIWGEEAAFPHIIALAGAGGKTSLIRRLAAEGMERGLSVLVVTTTHMYRPRRCGVLDGDEGEIRRLLREERLAVAGSPAPEGKMGYVGDSCLKRIAPLADLVLAESDGSKRLPFKVPGSGEPVIPPGAGMILAVGGLSALNRPGESCCHRWERAAELLDGCPAGRGDGTRLGADQLAYLMRKGYLLWLREVYPGVPVIPVWNQADTEELSLAGRQLLERMGETGGLVTCCDRPEPPLF